MTRDEGAVIFRAVPGQELSGADMKVRGELSIDTLLQAWFRSCSI